MATKVMRMRGKIMTTTAAASGKKTAVASKPHGRKKSCEHPSCPKQPAFSFNGSGVRFCAQHRLPGMVNVRNRRCEGSNCTKEPYFGERGGKARFCATHKPDKAMVDVRHRRCEFESCHKQPNYGYEGQRACYCSTHKLPTMVDVKHRRCAEAGCRGFSSFAFPGTKEKFCASHRREGMIPSRRGRTAAAAIASASASAHAGTVAPPTSKTASPDVTAAAGGDATRQTGSLPAVSPSRSDCPSAMVVIPRSYVKAAASPVDGVSAEPRGVHWRRVSSSEERDCMSVSTASGDTVCTAADSSNLNSKGNEYAKSTAAGRRAEGCGDGDGGLDFRPRLDGRREVLLADGDTIDDSSGVNSPRRHPRRVGQFEVGTIPADTRYVPQQRQAITMGMLQQEEQQQQTQRRRRRRRHEEGEDATIRAVNSYSGRGFIDRDVGGVRPREFATGTEADRAPSLPPPRHQRRRSHLESFGEDEEDEDRCRFRRRSLGRLRSISSPGHEQPVPHHRFHEQQQQQQQQQRRQLLPMPEQVPFHDRGTCQSSLRMPASSSTTRGPSHSSHPVPTTEDREADNDHHHRLRRGDADSREAFPGNGGGNSSSSRRRFSGERTWPPTPISDSMPDCSASTSVTPAQGPARVEVDGLDFGGVTPSLLVYHDGLHHRFVYDGSGFGGGPSGESAGDGNSSDGSSSSSSLHDASSGSDYTVSSVSRRSSGSSCSGGGGGGGGGGKRVTTWADTALVSRRLPTVEHPFAVPSTFPTCAGKSASSDATLNPHWRSGIPNARTSTLSNFRTQARERGNGQSSEGCASTFSVSALTTASAPSAGAPATYEERGKSNGRFSLRGGRDWEVAGGPMPSLTLSATPWSGNHSSSATSTSTSTSTPTSFSPDSSSSSSSQSSSWQPPSSSLSPVPSSSSSFSLSSVVTIHGGKNSHARLAKLSAVAYGGSGGRSLGPTLETLEIVL